MTHQRCELVNWALWPLLAAVTTSLYWPQAEISVLYSLTALVMFSHIHYGVCVVRQICGYLNCSCFTVPKANRN